jgi:hypothetical protein
VTSATGDQRYVPAAIRKGLRAEVNYGCPVLGCGNPYLSWHHFDPPWEPDHRHVPEGMIALCLPHHKAADPPTNSWTNEQLHEMKRNPYIKVGSSVNERIQMRRKEVILDCGGSIAIRPVNWLRSHGQNVIWITTDEHGYKLLNLDIRKSNGEQLIRMEGNDWTAFGPFKDLDAAPSQSSIKVSVLGDSVRLAVEFEEIDPAALESRYRSNFREAASKVHLDTSEPEDSRVGKWIRDHSRLTWPAELVTLRGNLVYPAPVEMKANLFRYRNSAASASSFSSTGALLIDVGFVAGGDPGAAGQNVIILRDP